MAMPLLISRPFMTNKIQKELHTIYRMYLENNIAQFDSFCLIRSHIQGVLVKRKPGQIVGSVMSVDKHGHLNTG